MGWRCPVRERARANMVVFEESYKLLPSRTTARGLATRAVDAAGSPSLAGLETAAVEAAWMAAVLETVAVACTCRRMCPSSHSTWRTHSSRRPKTSSRGRLRGMCTRLLHSEAEAARARAAAPPMEVAAARAVGWSVAVDLEAAEAARAEMAGRAVTACGA
eukprot:1340610-Prymnesium_polylepis.1